MNLFKFTKQLKKIPTMLLYCLRSASEKCPSVGYGFTISFIWHKISTNKIGS